MKTVYERVTDRLGPALPWIIAVTAACGFAFASAAHADESRGEKNISCSSNDGRRNECSADLRGYRLRDIDQASSTDCVVGRNWGYDDRGVWVDEGCRGEFIFTTRARFDRAYRAQTYGYSEPGVPGERRVTCASENGRRARCAADLHGYRFSDAHDLSRDDCEIGRNFGYDDTSVWVDDGCRGEFVFVGKNSGAPASALATGPSWDDWLPGSNEPYVRCESKDGGTVTCPAGGAVRVRLTSQLSKKDCVEGRTWGISSDGIWVDDGCRAVFEVLTRLAAAP
jgi:hypothetical protein